MTCTLCATPLDHRIDQDFYGCGCCGAYLRDRKGYLSPAQEKKRYEAHNNDVDDVGYQHFTSPITDAVLQEYAPAHLGLDYGCGTGPVIASMLRDRGYRVQLYDPFFYPDEAYLDYVYDYIFSCEVFEHFHHPKEEIQKLSSLLTATGRLYVMTHLYLGKVDFGGWYYRKDPTHVFVYTPKTMEYIGRQYGYAIEKMTERLVVLRKK